ncbi:MAG: DNA replication/repair protein RecF [Lachnospiraceae bacterium]|nr:DNA replication/repair protein RecF [Lachnospiraceae bacterium]
MIVKSLELSDYRNYETLSVQFHPGRNLIYGDNAQGKTNVLEAIYECATLRSHRGSKDRDIIRFGAEEAHIRLLMEKKGKTERIDVHLRGKKAKGAAVGGVALHRASELFGLLHVVFFSPEDLRIIKNSPQERRRFMDIELCQLSRFYTNQLIGYNKALLQRNMLLKEAAHRKEMLSVLEEWDAQLLSYGLPIMKEREKFIRELDEILASIHESLTGGRERLSLRYAPSVRAEAWEEKIFLSHDTDRAQQTTTLGPHRDELEFLIDGTDARRFGSQGQQRSAALSLKLAEIELVRRTIGDTPVLLLDDVLSELDGKRRERLLQSLDGVQTLLTCTGLDDFAKNSVSVDRRFYVTEGRMTEETQEDE